MVTVKNEPKSTHKKERASIPLESYLDMVSAISAKRTKWKVSSQASQSGWSMPTIFDGGTRQITLLANAPNSEDHKTTFVGSSPRRRGKTQTKPRKRETHSCNIFPHSFDCGGSSGHRLGNGSGVDVSNYEVLQQLKCNMACEVQYQST